MGFRDNGVKAIEDLMTRKGKFDYVLLETTGLADPGIVFAFISYDLWALFFYMKFVLSALLFFWRLIQACESTEILLGI